MKLLNISSIFCSLLLAISIQSLAVAQPKPTSFPSPQYLKVKRGLTAAKITFTEKVVATDDGSYHSIIIEPGHSKTGLGKEADRLKREYAGLKMAYSDELLKGMGVGGLFSGGPNLIFVDTDVFLDGNLASPIYKHELMHARSSVLLQQGQPSPFLMQTDPKDAGMTCDLDLLVEDNMYIKGGYWMEEAVANLIQLRYQLKAAESLNESDYENTEGEIVDEFNYVSDLVRCSQQIVQASEAMIKNSPVKTATVSPDYQKPVPYSMVVIDYSVSGGAAEASYYFPTNAVSSPEKIAALMHARLGALSHSLSQMRSFVDQFSYPKTSERATQLPRFVSQIDASVNNAFPEYFEFNR